MILSLIVAADENNVIGGGNRLLWQLPDDMKRFRELTDGHPVIMGRKTYESIGKALRNRRNIIVSRREWRKIPANCEVVPSLDAALSAVRSEREAFVIGGGEIYAQAMVRANRIYLTRVHAELVGDTFFPEIDSTLWVETHRKEHPVDDRHVHAFTFLTYERKKTS